jgi:hypothetical protein
MHYKRKNARVRKGRRGWDERRIKKAHPVLSNWLWLHTWPESYDIIHHRRPRRRKEKNIAHAIVRGIIDPERAIWPVSKKPHEYYW